MSIAYVPYNKIDKAKWDQCIDNAENGLVYAYSFYLDAMCKNWDALILNDYQSVMPLTWNKKYGFNYLYQPFFCASLGIFGNDIDENVVNDFFSSIPQKFKFWDIYLNYKNNIVSERFKLYKRRNYILSLEKIYEDLYSNFRENVKRNIKKTATVNCNIKTNIDIEEIIALAKDQSKTFSPIATEDFERFKIIFYKLKESQKAVTYGIYIPNGELVASAAFLFSHNRAYYILVGNHPNGKTIGASHALINAFIKDHANRNLILDFEGSDIQNLAFFYSGFGAIEEQYFGIKLNNLPFWAKWLKK
ncbi:MAG: hypothetical protein V4556_11045 [Bacteroidota bacterium]